MDEDNNIRVLIWSQNFGRSSLYCFFRIRQIIILVTPSLLKELYINYLT